VGGQAWLPVSAPRPELLLAPAACGLAVAVAMGMAAVETDLRHYRFGWRQLVPFTALVAFVIGLGPWLAGAVDGRWDQPGTDHVATLDQRLGPPVTGASRVLWLGHDDALAPASVALTGLTSLAVTDHSSADVNDRVALVGDDLDLVADALATARDGDTSRLGRLLAPFGVRWVVVMERLAPWPSTRVVNGIDPALRAGLAQQLDLVTTIDQAGLLVFENEAWVPVGASLAADALVGEQPGEVLAAGPVTATALTFDGVPPARASGDVAAGDTVWLAVSPDAGWDVTVGGRAAAIEEGLGWASRVVAADGGAVVASHATPVTHRVLMGGQVLLWVLALGALAATRDEPAAEARR
jgi:hypothetical protein